MNQKSYAISLPSHNSLLKDGLWIGAVALVYFAAAWFSLQLIFHPEGIAAIWPPEGIFLSALLLTRRNLRPWLAGVLFLTDLLSEMLAGTPLPLSFCYSLALTGSAVLSTWLLLRFVGEKITFGKVREIIGFLILAVGLSNMLMSVVAAAASTLLSEAMFIQSWQRWAASNGVGNLLVTPLILSLASLTKAELKSWTWKNILEWAALFFPLAFLNYFLFYRFSTHAHPSLLLAYTTTPFLLWAALRFGVRGTSLAVLILAAIAIYYAVGGHATSAPQILGDVIEIQLFLAIVTISSMFLAAVVAERRQAEAGLRIAAVAFEAQESIMITDADGVILQVNQAFTKTTGYTAEEAVGQTPRLIKSGRHSADFYRAMWENLHRTGTWQGEIWDRRKNGDVYPAWLTITAVKGDDGVVTHYVGTHIDITERKAAEEEIKSLAFYDPLTRLPNRRLLLDRLRQALASSSRSGRGGALLFIDLDNFKTLNDTLGHDIGDLLLQQVAQRLEPCVREGDTVARMGGDEFVMLLVDLSEHPLEAAAQTEIVGEKILATLNQPYQLAEHEFRSTTSIGAALFSDHGRGMDDIFKQADIAMYQAKKAGRNTLRFFDPKMQNDINERVALEGELRKALENRQFQLYYQIQLDSSLRPLGAEALIRWIHPEHGLVSPAQFISLAEETGLILPIGQWVLETACAQLKAWQQDVLTRDLVLAVNISARQFHQADFVAQVQAAVQGHAINPMRLKLELTESLLLENIEDTIATMNALKAIGVEFSLDDFGSGYSSLQYLKRLPLIQLKIDQSFIHDIATNSSDKAVVRAIIAMAQSLNLDVIAEGVEMEEQRQLLLGKGCTHYQGYLFGKPVPIEQFEALLKQG